jgi:nucleoside-diphosphate-sugar epimerase
MSFLPFLFPFWLQTGVIQAAVNGTLDILRACTKAKSVRRVIYTSSITAASPLKDKGEFRDFVDESCWTNVDLIRREKPLFWVNFFS